VLPNLWQLFILKIELIREQFLRCSIPWILDRLQRENEAFEMLFRK
jgi:hypothetical protein